MTFDFLCCILYVGDWFGLYPESCTAHLSTSKIWGFSFFKCYIWWCIIKSSTEHSVPSPLNRACYSTSYYYLVPPWFPSVKDILNDSSVNEVIMSPISRAICQVALLYLCRITELLHLTLNDVLHPDRVICVGAKRSSSFILFLPGLSEQIKKNALTDSSIRLFPVSYINCYRNFIKAGIRLSRPGYKNTVRCHIARYSVDRLSKKGYEMNVLGDLLHHKSKSSILYYLQK